MTCMPPQEDIPLTLLDRYLAGECSPDETIAVRQWISRQPSHTDVLAQVKAIQLVIALEPAWNADAMWDRVAPEVMGATAGNGMNDAASHVTRSPDATELADHAPGKKSAQPDAAPQYSTVRGPVPPATQTPSPYRPRLSALHRIALGAIVLVAGISGLFVGAKTFSVHPDRQLVKQATYHTVSTLQGQRAQFQLPDGSTVLLGPDTRLKYRSVAGHPERVIELYGEALFTVTHAERAPFIVRANGTTVQVLGTTFAVRKYNDESTARVVVAEGRVSVVSHSARQPVVLSTGEGAHVDDGTGAMTIDRAVSIRSALAWTQGRLDFARQPLRTVVADVARMYDIELRIASPALANQLVTGAIDDHLSPSDALAMLAGMVGGRVERSGSGFIFTER